MDIREDREPHIATERARSISGSQHEMGIFTRPWRRPWSPGVRLTLFKVNMSKDRGSRTMAPGLTPRGVVINFGRWAPLPVNPRYGAVVHSFKSRGPSRRGGASTPGRAAGTE